MIHTGCNIQGLHKQTNKQTKVFTFIEYSDKENYFKKYYVLLLTLFDQISHCVQPN